MTYLQGGAKAEAWCLLIHADAFLSAFRVNDHTDTRRKRSRINVDRVLVSQ